MGRRQRELPQQASLLCYIAAAIPEDTGAADAGGVDGGELRVADGLLLADKKELYDAYQGEIPRRCGWLEGVFEREWGGNAELDVCEGCGKGGCGAVPSAEGGVGELDICRWGVEHFRRGYKDT